MTGGACGAGCGAGTLPPQADSVPAHKKATASQIAREREGIERAPSKDSLLREPTARRA